MHSQQSSTEFPQTINNNQHFLGSQPSAHSLHSFFGGLQPDPATLHLSMAQLGSRLEKLEVESTMAQERINSLTRICQLQQQFQENWEEDQLGLKRYIESKLSGAKSNLSLKEELDIKSGGVTLDGL